VPEPHDIEIRKNVEFGVHDDVVLTGDYYAPPGAGPYPALIALHGGFWKRGTAEGYQYWGSYLAEHGYVLFSINYRLVEGTRNRYPAAVHDARAAVQFMRNKATALKADPKRIGCIGDSAGAHLAALVALTGDAPRFVRLTRAIRTPGRARKSKWWLVSMARMICWLNGSMIK
jgi:acetyl esterase/lipase